MFSPSPRRVPATMHTMTQRVLRVPIMLDTPMPSTHSPSTEVIAPAKRALILFLKSSPSPLPTSTRTTLIRVPIICIHTLSRIASVNGILPLHAPFVKGKVKVRRTN